MKNVIAFVLLLSFLVAAPIYASVHTRLQLVSNEAGILVVEVQAMSDDGTPQIDTYRGAFKISETLEKRVVAVGFQNFLFYNDNYEQLLGYSSEYRKVTWVYTLLENGQYASMPDDWTAVLRVVIVYNTSTDNATITWAGSPSYLVKDQNGANITGDYMPIPPELQDFPLPVELTSFSANRSENSVLLNWRTESELNNLGFHVYRSDQETEGFQRLTEELIRGQGSTSSAHDYTYVDETIDPAKDYWYTLETVSTDGLSTFYGPVESKSLSTIENKFAAAPAEFALEQNYPNPFNPSTEIRFHLTESVNTTLTIYDVRGHIIRTLLSGIQDAGEHRVTWDGLDASGTPVNSGVYLYELKAGDEVFYRKMTLIR